MNLGDAPPASWSTPSGRVYHLCPAQRWVEQRHGADYEPEGFGAEGFVHTTIGLDATLVPANRYYADDARPHVCLTIDLDLVNVDVRFDAEPHLYPHIYGPVPTGAVIEVRDALRAPDGAFTGFGPPVDTH
ncbi:MAG: DUF952 domain-containing protein [Microthrixaceae bacterium]